ncbi:G-D-S-L family lipolytic protein [Planoprotostelium fungivorum]|uniref:G-D-S-L family lipolytic protein n=1 Tax=Planoprotostelium fungivorum TaxID=1890364 RepID=A0A2P6NTA3_9EUKA|nr:G-D-S-L family lipolytic protein [Planoprotostelium fungivorum]
MRASLLLFVVCLSQLVTADFTAAADSRIYHTKWNWYINASIGSIEAANCGPYVKFTITNTTQVSVVLDLPQRNDYFANIAWSIDNGVWKEYHMGNDTNVLLVDSLKPQDIHTVFLYIKNSNGWVDRWVGPSTNIRILGFDAPTGTIFNQPSDMSSKTMAVYGDSIAQGANTVELPTPHDFTIETDDAFPSFGFAVASAIGAEVSLLAWGGQGMTGGGSGNVPPLWSEEGTSNTSSWNWHNSKVKREFDECPNVILNVQGTNDGLFASKPQVTEKVLGWLISMRQTCPKSKIFQVVPFGRYSEEFIVKGFQQYRKKSNDRHAHLIQLGATAAKGLDHVSPSFCSGDGVHPWGWRSSQLGAQLAVAIAKYL